MITDKQKQKDFEYDADYKTRSQYTAEQWTNILNSGQFDQDDLSLLKEIYSSYNHLANVKQLAFSHQISQEEVLARVNQMGKVLAEANSLEPEVDYEGNEYWWYLCFWGKNSAEAGALELKMQPELTEAIGGLWPELEQAYYALVSDVDRSLQTRYSQEDSVWIAAAVLLYEKYYQFPGISPDDILLMQYEVQTKAQKVFGQDIDSNTISVLCNADERGHHYNYLRDIYKYYRVAFPGEFEDDRERPDPKDLDYNAYVYTIFGYKTLNEIYNFIQHEYAHLVDESYVELNAANGFVRLADFLTRKGGMGVDPEDRSEAAIELRAAGEDAVATFHMISEALIKEYPNFSYAHKADWFLEADRKIPYIFYDQLYMQDYAANGACISFVTVPEGDAVHIEISLNLPYCQDEEVMLRIQDKCNMLTLMTTAAFKVETCNPENHDLDTESLKIKASVLYPYETFITMKEEDIIGTMSPSMEIFASYYTDICQNYYPADGGAGAEDPLAAALGSKLVYRQAADVPGPQVIYKEGTSSSTTDFVTRTIQGYGQLAPGTLTNQAYADSQYAGAAGTPEEMSGYAGSGVSAEAAAMGDNLGNDNAGSRGSGSGVGFSGRRVHGPGSDDLESEFSGSVRISGRTALGGQSGTGASGAGAVGAGATGPGAISAGAGSQGAQAASMGAGGRPAGQPMAGAPAMPMPGWGMPMEEKVPVSTHPDRSEQGFRLYPKNTLIKGPVKTGKFHEAILTAVGIIEGKEHDMVAIEPVPEVLDHYMNYVEEGRIMQVSYPDLLGDGYDGWIEYREGPYVRDGIFKEFANRCAEGRYVVMMEDVDLDWTRLFGETAVLLRENRREGTSSQTTITLPRSRETFKLPSNLFIVATCDSVVCEETILGAIQQDFFIKHVNPDASVLRSMRVEGITLERLMEAINLRVSYFLGADYQLGEGFFLASPDKDPMVSLGRTFREQIIPLLEKWFDGDIERIRYVLGDNGKRDSESIFYQEIPFRNSLFRGHIPDSFDTERIIYKINEKAFFNPRSYIGVYE